MAPRGRETARLGDIAVLRRSVSPRGCRIWLDNEADVRHLPAVERRLGTHSLRHALTAASAPGGWAALHYVMAGGHWRWTSRRRAVERRRPIYPGGRLIPNFRIRFRKVLGLRPRRSAACPRPSMVHS